MPTNDPESGRTSSKATSERSADLEATSTEPAMTAILRYIITSGVDDIRSILGGGRRIVRDSNGKLHATVVEIDDLDASLIYASSETDGEDWMVQHVVDQALTVEQWEIRNPAIVWTNDVVSIAHQRCEQQSPCGPFVFHNAAQGDENAWELSGPVTSATPMWMPTISASPTDNNVYATWVQMRAYGTSPFRIAKSTDNGNTWTELSPHQDSTWSTNALLAPAIAPVVAGSGGYVLIQYYVDDPSVVDTTITNHANPLYGGWPHITESSNGGYSWSNLSPVFGPSRSNFPTMTGWVDGIPRTLYVAGGANWANVSQGFVSNGKVYVLWNAYTIDPLGTLNCISAYVVSYKPAGVGGAWTHRVVSPEPVFEHGALVLGYANSGELSVCESDPDKLVLAYFDAASRAIQVAGSIDGGSSWRRNQGDILTYDQVADLGFTQRLAIYMHAVPVFASNSVLDILYVQADTVTDEVTDRQVFSSRLNVSSLLSEY